MKIQNYLQDGTVSINDQLLGIDSNDDSKTKTYTLESISNFFGTTPKYKVFTALLTQSGTDTEDSINSGELLIGRTYRINQNSPGMDFTNVGAPNNNLNTSFIATAENPASWGSGATYTLAYSAGAPTVKILENTIGNVWFTYDNPGNYLFNSDGLFTINTTVNTLDQTGNISDYGDGIYYAYMFTESINTQRITILDQTLLFTNDMLDAKLIEIRVYN